MRPGRRWRSARRSASTPTCRCSPTLGHARDDVRRFGARVLERTGRWHAPLAAELEAFALGARLEPELVAALNGRTELLALAECTTVGRCASAEGPWLAQNWDWYADAPERCLVWSAAVEGARFATMTEAGILAKVGRLDARHRRRAQHPLPRGATGADELGIPVHLVLRRLLEEAASAGDAWDAAARDAVLGLQLHHRARRRRRRRLLRALARRGRADRAARRPARPHQPLPRRRRSLAPRQSSRPNGCRARARGWRRRRARAARSRRRARAARDPRDRSAGDLPARRAARRARASARRHGRLARDAPGQFPSCAWPPGGRASTRSCATRSDRPSGARRGAPRGGTSRAARARRPEIAPGLRRRAG